MKMSLHKKVVFSIVLLLFFAFSPEISCGAAPTFDELTDGMKLEVLEDSNFVYIVNATDSDIPSDYPLIFSDDSETKLPIFSMTAFNDSDNNRRAIIDFTPSESDVLDSNKNISNYHISIIVKDQTFATSVVDILFNITNVNDPPSVTSFTPSSTTPSVQENSTLTFSFDNTTADPDLVHPGADYLNNTWYLNNTFASYNVSWSYAPGFCDEGIKNVTLVVNDSYKNTTSISWIVDVTNKNRPPVNNATIQNLTWSEGSNLTNNLTLEGYFNDSDRGECSGSNKDSLTYGYISYGVTNSVNSSKSVNVSINATTGNVSFYVEDDWYGVEIIAFYANDSYDITYSNNITLNVTNINDGPILQEISNQALKIGSLFTLSISAFDADNDTLYFYANSTVINISLATGIINFTPSEDHMGNYTVNITVNDSWVIDSQLVNFIISNDTPPVFSGSISNITWRSSSNLTNNLTLSDYFSDADGDNLTYGAIGNSSILIVINQTTSSVSFYPAAGWSGIEYIKFFATDGYFTAYSNNITLNATPNNPPQIHNIYPYGDGTSNLTIYDWVNPALYPDGTSIYIYENTNVEFKQNSSDADGDNLTYQWILNGTLLNTTQNITYYFNFTSAGIKNLTLSVSDGFNTTTFYWSINITNLNRPVIFGTKTYTSYDDFLGGTLNNTNITAQSGNVTLRMVDGFYVNGTYTSPSIDTGADADKINFTNITWSRYLQDGANITLKTRTASTSAGLSSAEWSALYTNSSVSPVNSTGNQYIQFMAMLSTKDNTKTPVLESVDIYYEITTPALLEDYIYENWIDLDDYFQEIDSDDNLTFHHTSVSNINMSIDSNTHVVRLSFTPDWYGTENFRFYANDSHSLTYSNNITIIVSDAEDEAPTTTIINVGGGGGGGVSRVTKTKTTTEYEFPRLLVPGPVSLISVNKVKVPITVENNIQESLKNIYLSAESTEEGVSFEFDTSYISEIGKGDKKTINLFVTSFDKELPYTITVNAKVTAPSLNDSIIIQINPLENITTKVKMVMDMLKANPECFELNELVVNAKKAINNKEYEKADKMLEEVLRSCRFILAKKEEAKKEKPSPWLNAWPWFTMGIILIASIWSFYFIKAKKLKIFKKWKRRE